MKRRFRRRPAHWVTLAILLALVVLGRLAQRHFFSPKSDGETSPPQLSEGEYRLDRVVDGDTIIIFDRGRRLRVRLLAIDTPEVFKHDESGRVYSNNPDPFALEASKFTKDFLAGGKVRLRFGRRRVDQYGRLLAFVFVDDRSLNEQLVRAGLARAEIYPGDENSLTNAILKAQREAHEARRGIWSQP